jgi:hypothetical protein
MGDVISQIIRPDDFGSISFRTDCNGDEAAVCR